MKDAEVIAKIVARGGVFVRQKGSHQRYRVTVDEVTCFTTVQKHSGKDIPVGTLSQIQRDLAPALGEGWLK